METCAMSDPRLSLQLKLDYRGGKSRQPFWRRYWQSVLLALTIAAIFAIARQF
jgi:hypothetical protein